MLNVRGQDEETSPRDHSLSILYGLVTNRHGKLTGY